MQANNRQSPSIYSTDFPTPKNSNKSTAMMISPSVKHVLLFVLLYLSVGHYACADEDYIKAQIYINTYQQLAVEEMHRTGVPASIKLAQGMLETGYGTSRLALEGNNHFGIKCKNYWKGDTIRIDDDAPQECFRRYPSVYHSYIDHSNFLLFHRNGHYKHLFDYGKTNYKAWANGLKKAGYATNKHYANGLINIIERYNLSQFDYVTNPSALASNTTSTYKPVYKRSDNSSTQRKNTQTASNSTYKPVYKRPTQTTPTTTTRTTTTVTQKPVNKPSTSSPTRTAVTPVQDNNGVRTTKTYEVTHTNQQKVEEQLFMREVLVNGCKAVQANAPVHLAYIAKLYRVPLQKIYKYNDTQPGKNIPANTYVYLEPKKAKSSGNKRVHTVQEDESMFDIAQQYGIKLNKLYKRNRIRPGMQPLKGELIYLSHKAPYAPKAI